MPDCGSEAIRLVLMMHVRFPLALRNVDDLIFELGINICRETVLNWSDGSVRCPRPYPPAAEFLAVFAEDRVGSLAYKV